MTLVVNRREPWRLGTENIPLISPGDSAAYLGKEYDPWSKTENGESEKKLIGWLDSIDKAPLKPTQKMEMLLTYTLPRLYHLLAVSDVSTTRLCRTDKVIKGFVKKWLHLPACITDGVLYSRKLDGGLGVPRLAKAIPIQKIRRWLWVIKAKDKVIRTIAQIMKVKDKISHLCEVAKLNHPKPGQRNYFHPWRKEEFERWRKLEVQGNGIKYFENWKCSNSWLNTAYGYIHQSTVISGLLLRTGTFPVRATMNRAYKDQSKACRRCNAPNESLAHISGQCPWVKNYRIKRHNNIRDMLAEKGQKCGWKVLKECTFIDDKGKSKRPDLIFYGVEDTAIIVDVTVRYEDRSRTLEAAITEKVKAYKHLEETVLTKTASKKFKVTGLAVGARGGWCKEDSDILKDLGIKGQNFSKKICNEALGSTIKMLRIFGGERYIANDGDCEFVDS